MHNSQFTIKQPPSLFRVSALTVSIVQFALCISLAQQNPNGPNKFYYSSGQVSSEGNLVNGKPDGYWKSYYENGKLKSEGNRINLNLDGPWKFYSDKGVISSEAVDPAFRFSWRNLNSNRSSR